MSCFKITELSIHPAPNNDHHEISLICDDIKEFVRQVNKQEIVCSEIQNQGWGLLVQLTLPGGGKLSVYQPMHERPLTNESKSVNK
jgi:hypothetical protein